MEHAPPATFVDSAPAAERAAPLAEPAAPGRQGSRGRGSGGGWLARLRQADLATILVVVALAISAVHFAYTLIDYRNVFVHPDNHQQILRQSTNGGHGFGFQDVVNSFQLRGENEFRPRWLAYFIQGIDHKLRLWAYQWVPVHPTVQPVAWFFQLVVAPYFLYRLLVNVTGDRLAGLAAVAVYTTMTGFLSGFTMALLQGKTLSNVIVILALYCASVAARTLRPGQMLVASPGPAKYLMLLVLLTGLYLDEMPIAAFAIVPLFFWMHFLPAWGAFARPTLGALRPFVLNGLFFLVPMFAFLGFVLLIAPSVTEYFWGYRFDYLSDTLHLGGNTRSGDSVLSGPHAALTLGVVLENFTTLFGYSLAPWFVAPLQELRFGPFPATQVNNLPKAAIFLVFFGFAGYVAWKARGQQYARHLCGLLVAIAVYILFISVLSIRHIPIVTGYYYGAAFAALFALLIGMLLHGAALAGRLGRPVAALAVVAIVSTQIVNFLPTNAGWIYAHNELMMRNGVERLRSGLRRRLPLSEERGLTRAEVDGIWSAWQRGRMDQHIKEVQITPAAVYVFFELREIDRVRSRDDGDGDD